MAPVVQFLIGGQLGEEVVMHFLVFGAVVVLVIILLLLDKAWRHHDLSIRLVSIGEILLQEIIRLFFPLVLVVHLRHWVVICVACKGFKGVRVFKRLMVLVSILKSVLLSLLDGGMGYPLIPWVCFLEAASVQERRLSRGKRILAL